MERTKFSICHEFIQRYIKYDSTNINLAQNLWDFLRCEKLPLPIAQVVYFISDNGNNKQGAIKLLQESYNIIGEAHLDVFSLLCENGTMDGATIDGCVVLEKQGLHFYTARHLLRQHYSTLVKKSSSTQNDKIHAMYNSLMQHLSLMEWMV